MPDLVVVPSPLRQARALRRLCDAQGGLLLGPRVTTLGGLVPGLLAAAGEARHALSPLAERLVALGAAREAGLVGDVRPAHGAARSAMDLVAELRQGEVTAAAAAEAAVGLPGRPGERLAAAAAALSAYEARLGALQALDEPAALRAAAAAAHRGVSSEELRGLGLLVLEGLLRPTPGNLDLALALVERAGRVVARIPYFPGRPDRSRPAEPWLRCLESLHEAVGRRDVSVVAPGASVEMPGALAAPRRIRVLPSPGDEEQAEAAARLVGRLLDDGMAPEDVVVVAPRRLASALSRAFAAAGVPFASGTPVPLSALPLVRHLGAAIDAAGAFERSAAEALLASPYLGLGDAPAGVGRLLTSAGALDGRGDPEEALRARAARLTDTGPRAGRERKALLRAAEALRGARAALRRLQGPATPREWALRLRTFVERAGVRRRAARGDAEVARRDLAALARWEEAVDDLAGALAMTGRGDEAIGRAELAGLLELALQSAALPAPGEPAAGAVELWPPEEAPGLTARAALVLGAERGTWPVAPRADPLVGDQARATLNAHLRRRAVSTGPWRQSEGDHLGFSALCSATELLAVGWNGGPHGEGPAPLAAEVLGPGGGREQPLTTDPPLAEARSISEALRAASRLAREGHAAAAQRALVVGGPELLARACSAAARGALEQERRQAWLSGRAVPSAGQVPPALAEAWQARLPGEWSASLLETFARCPYRLFLELAGMPDGAGGELDIAPRDEGSLLHGILEAFLRQRVAAGAWPLRATAEEREEAARAAREVFATFEAQGRVGDPATWEARRAAVLSRVQRWIGSEARDHAGLRPELLEFRFGGDSGRPPLVVRDRGEEVRLEGRIDRVDADPDRLLVLDYKNARDSLDSRARLDPAALGATSFQAPLYLLAAARELPGRGQLAASYALLRSGERVEPWRVAAGDGFLALDEARRAEVRTAGGRTFADGVIAAVRRIRRGELPIASRDCTGCPYGAVCRFPDAGGDA